MNKWESEKKEERETIRKKKIEYLEGGGWS